MKKKQEKIQEKGVDRDRNREREREKERERERKRIEFPKKNI